MSRAVETAFRPGRIEPGTRFDKYRVLHCIARGGMASVWAAHYRGARGFTKLVALKLVLPELAAEPAFERMLQEEAQLAAQIRHPNVCETFELIESDGVLALSMEWVDGESLARLLAAGNGPLDARIAARIVAQVAAGLHAAHELQSDAGLELNLVHRDVSPQNILISRGGHVKLSDFGIAKAFTEQCESTATGQVKGKLAYMSPEQAQHEQLDRRSDVFSLGVVLYCAALGQRPFARANEPSAVGLARLRAGKYPRPCDVNPALPRGLASIIERALQADRARRYQSAAELRNALEGWLSRSGPTVTEQDVARTLNERCEAALTLRARAIRTAMDWHTQLTEMELDPDGQDGRTSAVFARAPADVAPRDPLVRREASSPVAPVARWPKAPWLLVTAFALATLLGGTTGWLVASGEVTAARKVALTTQAAPRHLAVFTALPPTAKPPPAVPASALDGGGLVSEGNAKQQESRPRVTRKLVTSPSQAPISSTAPGLRLPPKPQTLIGPTVRTLD